MRRINPAIIICASILVLLVCPVRAQQSPTMPGASTGANSQTQSPEQTIRQSAAEIPRSGPVTEFARKGKFTASGDFGYLLIGYSPALFSVVPEAGYFIADGFNIGLGLVAMYTNSEQKYTGDTKDNSETNSRGVRIKPIYYWRTSDRSRVFPYVGGELTVVQSDYRSSEKDSPTYKYKSDRLMAGAGAGLAFATGEDSGSFARIGLHYLRLESDDNVEGSGGGSESNADLITLMFAFGLYF